MRGRGDARRLRTRPPEATRRLVVPSGIFGNLDRLDVAVAVALSEDGVVNATDLSWSLQIANNRVRAQLIALTDLGFLQPDEGSDSRKRQYLRLDDPFWDTCLDLYRRWSGVG